MRFRLSRTKSASSERRLATVARDPISKTRQRQQGDNHGRRQRHRVCREDLTLSSFRDFIEGFVFAEANQS